MIFLFFANGVSNLSTVYYRRQSLKKKEPLADDEPQAVTVAERGESSRWMAHSRVASLKLAPRWATLTGLTGLYL